MNQIYQKKTLFQYALYQIDSDISPVAAKVRFRSYAFLESHGLKVDPAHYRKVYEGQIQEDDAMRVLEALFTMFNVAHPKDFTGCSMSMSDVVVLRNQNSETAYYCDIIGFKKLGNVKMGGWPWPANYEVFDDFMCAELV